MVCAIILAAGSSQRFGSDKRLACLPDGTQVLGQTLTRVLAVFDQVLLVLREDDQALAARLQEAFTHPGLNCFCAPDSALGMGHNLASAMTLLAERPGKLDGVFVFLADMPFVKVATLQLLQTSFQQHPDAIQVPVFKPPPAAVDLGEPGNASDQPAGQRGHPVAFGSRYLAELQRLGQQSPSGQTSANDRGARILLQRHASQVVEVLVQDEGVIRDIDRPDDLTGD